MSKQPNRIVKAAAAVIEDLRVQRRLSQEELAGRAGIKYGTYRNMARGDVDVKVPDLVAIAAALSTTPLAGGEPKEAWVTAAEIADMIVVRAGGFDELVSEARANKDDLEARRLQKEAEKMRLAEIEALAEAALKDEQMDEQPDEPGPA